MLVVIKTKIMNKSTFKLVTANIIFISFISLCIIIQSCSSDSSRKINKMIDDEKEAKTVKLIYKWSLKGIGTNKIAGKLNELEIPTRYTKIGKGTLKTIYKSI